MLTGVTLAALGELVARPSGSSLLVLSLRWLGTSLRFGVGEIRAATLFG